jgi:hypothetical protein
MRASILRSLGLSLLAVLAAALRPSAAPDQATVTVDRNTGKAATHAFKFARVPSPSAEDAATKAKMILVDGEFDPNGGSVAALNDGLWPRDEDEPGANFFFDAGTGGGRFAIDLTKRVEIAQVNSYSWHPDTRGPQIYTLYASDGADPAFNASPKSGTDPTTVGWTRIAGVNTAPKEGEAGGGQYGVSISGPSGSLGTFRYLLFECVVTETQDDYGNTFYSEIDVVAKPGAPPASTSSSSNPRLPARISRSGRPSSASFPRPAAPSSAGPSAGR